eukprot:758018-Hanusia_phi.AAC.3
MVRLIGPSNAKWYVNCASDFAMTSQKKSELDMVLRRLNRNDPRLSELSLSWLECGDFGADLVAHALKVNVVLKELDLYHNDIGPQGASSLARSLETNSTLISLNLDMNNVGDEGANELLQMLRRNNTSLVKLSLANNHVNPVLMAEINTCVHKNNVKKLQSDWQQVRLELKPLMNMKGELESQLQLLQANSRNKYMEADSQYKTMIQEELAGVREQIERLERKEDHLMEEASWFQKSVQRFHQLVKVEMNVTKAIQRMRTKKTTNEGILEQQRNENYRKLTTLEQLMLQPEARRWSKEYSQQMQEELKKLKLEEMRFRVQARSSMAHLALKDLDAQPNEEAKQKTETSVQDIDKFKPKADLKYHLDMEEMPLSGKYLKFDRKMREAGLNILKSNITYQPLAEDRRMGKRFQFGQEAFLDPQDRTYFGARVRDRNPKNIYYKKNKYGADLAF